MLMILGLSLACHSPTHAHDGCAHDRPRRPRRYPAGHDKDTYSQLDLEDEIALGAFPHARRARGLEAVLVPGDVLFLPAYVWHYVRQLDEGAENISLSFGVEDERTTLTACPGGRPPEFEAIIHAAAGAYQAAILRQGSRAPTEREGERQSDRADDDAIESAHDDLGLRCKLASRWVEERALEQTGSVAQARRLLSGLAVGADATRSEGGANAFPEFADVIGPINTESHLLATRLRAELMRYVGSGELANAVLRATVRGGTPPC